MKVLLDTHLLLWAAGLPERLSPKARSLLEAPDAQLFFSAASLWEIAIKRAARRLRAPADLGSRVLASGFEPVPITFAHAEAAGSLPRIHGDPFDRMLVAQAQAERLTIVTVDRGIARYDVDVLTTG